MCSLRYWLLGLALALSWACGGGGGSSPAAPPGPAAPGDFQVLNPQSASLELRWTDSSPSRPDGYAIQGRFAAGAFGPLHSGLLPADTRSALVTFSTALPELTLVEFRIRSEQGGAASDWAVASYQYPVLAPWSLHAYQKFGTEQVQLQWLPASQVATSSTILRREAGVSASEWTLLATIDGPDTSLVDLTAKEGVSYQYAIRQSAPGGATSPLTTSSVLTLPCRPPTDLAGAWNGSAVDLTWKVQSQTANRQWVYRYVEGGTWGLLATLDGSASAFRDVSPVQGLAWYWIEAASPAMSFPIQSVRALVPPLMLGGFRARLLDIPVPQALVPSPLGGWWLLSGQDVGGHGVLSHRGGLRDISVALGTFVAMGLQLDGAGRPHLFGRFAGQMPGYAHAWLEGDILTSESLDAVLPKGVYLGQASFLTMPGDGFLILAREPITSTEPSPILRLERTAAGWTRSILPMDWVPDGWPDSACTSDGTLLVGLSRQGDAIPHLGWWKGDGTRGVDDLAGLSVASSILPTPWDETFVFGHLIRPDNSREPRALYGQPGLWQGPEIISGAPDSLFPGRWVADPVSQRLACMGTSIAATESSFLFRANGTWTLRPAGFLADGAFGGTNTQGKFWFIAPLSRSSAPYPVLLLEEP